MMFKIKDEPIKGLELQEILDYVYSLAKVRLGIRYTKVYSTELVPTHDLSNPDKKTYWLCSENYKDSNCCIIIDYSQDTFSAEVSWAMPLD